MDNEELTSLAQESINIEMAVFEMHSNFEEQSKSANDPRIKDRLEEMKNIRKSTKDVQESINIQRNEIKQALLMNSFEVVGIPDGAVENTEDLADVLSRILNERVEESTIAGFESLDPEPVGHSACSSQPVKVTAVHMTERSYRDRILRLAGSSPLRLNDAEEPLLIREHLTHMNKMMLKKTLNRAAQNNISKVWVKDGMIFIRKTDTSPSVQIRCDADIEKMHLY